MRSSNQALTSLSFHHAVADCRHGRRFGLLPGDGHGWRLRMPREQHFGKELRPAAAAANSRVRRAANWAGRDDHNASGRRAVGMRKEGSAAALTSLLEAMSSGYQLGHETWTAVIHSHIPIWQGVIEKDFRLLTTIEIAVRQQSRAPAHDTYLFSCRDRRPEDFRRPTIRYLCSGYQRRSYATHFPEVEARTGGFLIDISSCLSRDSDGIVVGFDARTPAFSESSDP